MGRGVVATGGVLGALAASACCILPLALVTLGVGGAWVSHLTALAPYQPWFLTGTAALLAMGYRMAYQRKAPACAEGSACARPIPRRAMRLSLWFATALVIASLAVDIWGRLVT